MSSIKHAEQAPGLGLFLGRLFNVERPVFLDASCSLLQAVTFRPVFHPGCAEASLCWSLNTILEPTAS